MRGENRMKIYIVHKPYDDRIYYAGNNPELAGRALAAHANVRESTVECDVWEDDKFLERWGA